MIHDHEPRLYSFLFCQDVIHEKNGGVTPFRVVDGYEYDVSASVKDPEFSPFNVGVFLALDCDCEGEHTHNLKMDVRHPDDAERSSESAIVFKHPGIAYRNFNVGVPGELVGCLKFTVSIDGKVAGQRQFLVTRKVGSE
jgi:hypothetical protein